MLEIQQGSKKNPHEWSDETKIKAATAIMVHGNARLVSKEMGIPWDTLMRWRKEDWWISLTNELKQTRKDEVNGKLNNAVDKALDVVQDRLEHGDFVLNNKTGEIIRKPVNLKDANSVISGVIKTQIEMNRAQEMQEVQESMPDILKNLATEFAKFNRKVATQTVIDVNFKEIPNVVDSTQSPMDYKE